MKLYSLMFAVPLLAACSSNYIVENPANNATYQPPFSSQNAVITGKLEPGDSRLISDRVAYITAIDAKPVFSNRIESYNETWNNAYPISVGNHTVSAIYRVGGFSIAPVQMQLNVQPDRSYQLDFATDIGTGWSSQNNYVDLWIVDRNTGQRVSEVVRTQPKTEFQLPFISTTD